MNTIITIKAHKRPYYLKEVVNSLEDRPGIEGRKIMVSLDLSPTTMDESKAIIENSKIANQIELIIHTEKQGCAGNMKFCFDYAFEFNKYDAMIHLEDDTIVGGDYLQWMDWYLEYIKDKDNILALCPFRSQNHGGSKGELEESFLLDHFECMGGFGIIRNQWEYIKQLGGLFGIVGPASTVAPPDVWKSMQHITWDGSWAWPINKYFRRNKVCIHSKVGRTNNIGAKEGRFNPNEQWHKENIYDRSWIGSEKYMDIDLSNVKYKEPIDKM